MIHDKLLKDRSEEVLDYVYLRLRRIEQSTKELAILFMVFTFIFIIASIFIFARLSSETSQIEKIEKTKEIEEVPFSLEYNIGYWTIHKPNEVNDSSLYVFLVENGAWYPDVLLRHAKLESGNYTSNVYRNNNNLFGMKKVSRRPTTQTGANSYGIYKNWCLSALDRILWDIDHFKTKPTRSDYLKAFNTYGEDPNYINKVK